MDVLQQLLARLNRDVAKPEAEKGEAKLSGRSYRMTARGLYPLFLDDWRGGQKPNRSPQQKARARAQTRAARRARRLNRR